MRFWIDRRRNHFRIAAHLPLNRRETLVHLKMRILKPHRLWTTSRKEREARGWTNIWSRSHSYHFPCYQKSQNVCVLFKKAAGKTSAELFLVSIVNFHLGWCSEEWGTATADLGKSVPNFDWRPFSQGNTAEKKPKAFLKLFLKTESQAFHFIWYFILMWQMA